MQKSKKGGFKSGQMGRARAARAARAVFIGGFSPKTSNRKHSGRSGRSGPALLAPFCDPLFGTFLRTVCKDDQKTTTLWGSKMTPMANSLALWPSPPLAMSSLASGRSGTHRGMHAYSWWGSSPRIFPFARSYSASVRSPSRFQAMSSRSCSNVDGLVFNVCPKERRERKTGRRRHGTCHPWARTP